jgi:hypothetical protein
VQNFSTIVHAIQLRNYFYPTEVWGLYFGEMAKNIPKIDQKSAKSRLHNNLVNVVF